MPMRNCACPALLECMLMFRIFRLIGGVGDLPEVCQQETAQSSALVLEERGVGGLQRPAEYLQMADAVIEGQTLLTNPTATLLEHPLLT